MIEIITEKSDTENDRELVEMILNEVPPLPFPDLYLEKAQKVFEKEGFVVESCFPKLLHAQEVLEQNGVIEGRIHRFLLVTRK